VSTHTHVPHTHKADIRTQTRKYIFVFLFMPSLTTRASSLAAGGGKIALHPESRQLGMMEGHGPDKLRAKHEGIGSFSGNCGSHVSSEENAPSARRPETTGRIEERRRYHGAGGDIRPVRSLRNMMQNRKESITNGSVANLATMANLASTMYNVPFKNRNAKDAPEESGDSDTRTSCSEPWCAGLGLPDRFRGGGGIVSRVDSSLASSPLASHQFFPCPLSLFFCSVLLCGKHFNLAL
jgi:hypothetical protein